MVPSLTPLHNPKDVISGKPLIKVYLRTRPLLEKEILDGASNILKVSPIENKVLVEDGSKGCFFFDGVCDEDETQEELFRKFISPLLKNIEGGQNVNVIAYGQTGSGKTYTIGTNPVYSQENGGMLQRVMSKLLEKDKNIDDNTGKRKQTFKMTFLEVYNENCYDLFKARKIIETKADGFGGVIPVNCHEEIVSSTEEGLLLLEKGNNIRSVAATAMNSHSSRSHALISMTLYQTIENGTDIPKGCLRMVDLAGAEGVGRNNTEGKNFCEGVSINKGLLAVGKVLTALSTNSSSAHIPYRESIVTRLLRDALGGNNCNTAMIVCVNPASTNLSVTLNTLRYAEQARNIKIKQKTFSTLKKSIKRRLDDASYNSSAWKKFASEKKKSHNSTISTPGHKPPTIKIQHMNNTFMTSLNRSTEFARQFPRSSSRTDLRSIGELLKPAFEDVSPTPSIIEGPMGNNSILQISPLVEKMSSRFEQSILHYEQRMEHKMKEMENKLARKVAKMIIKGANSRRSKRLELKKGSSSILESPVTKKTRRPNLSIDTPTNENSDSDLGMESPFSLADSIAEALMKKKNFQSALQLAVKEDTTENKNLETSHSSAVLENTLKIRSPFKEIFNTTVTAFDETNAAFKKENIPIFLPITSTVACDGKMVRRSTRITIRRQTQFGYVVSPVTNVQTHLRTENSSFGSKDSSTMDQTVIFRNEEEFSASPDFTNKSAIRKERNNVQKVSLDTSMSMPFCSSIPDVTFSAVSRRRSTRKSAFHAIQAIKKDCEILSAKSPAMRTLQPRRSSKQFIRKDKSDKSMLMGKENWNQTVVSPSVHKEHNDEILAILNSASLRDLQKLPTIGPKTAMVIYNFRKMFGKLNTLEDLQHVPGFTKSYCTRFMKANLIIT